MAGRLVFFFLLSFPLFLDFIHIYTYMYIYREGKASRRRAMSTHAHTRPDSFPFAQSVGMCPAALIIIAKAKFSSDRYLPAR